MQVRLKFVLGRAIQNLDPFLLGRRPSRALGPEIESIIERTHRYVSRLRGGFYNDIKRRSAIATEMPRDGLTALCVIVHKGLW